MFELPFYNKRMYVLQLPVLRFNRHPASATTVGPECRCPTGQTTIEDVLV